MDYIFFAVNALSVGLSVLFLIDRFRPDNRSPIKLFHYLISLTAAAVYYSLDSGLFSKVLSIYLAANLLPILLLVTVATFAFLRSPSTGK